LFYLGDVVQIEAEQSVKKKIKEFFESGMFGQNLNFLEYPDFVESLNHRMRS